MNKTFILIIASLFATFVFAGCSNQTTVDDLEIPKAQNTQESEQTTQNQENKDSMDDNMNKDNMEKEEMPNKEMMKGEVMDFTNEEYQTLKASDKTIVLNFHATWCPGCKTEVNLIENEVKSILPENVVILNVNYKDSDADEFEEALVEEFGISHQGDKVLLRNGEVIGTVNGHIDFENWEKLIAKLN